MSHRFIGVLHYSSITDRRLSLLVLVLATMRGFLTNLVMTIHNIPSTGTTRSAKPDGTEPQQPQRRPSRNPKVYILHLYR